LFKIYKSSTHTFHNAATHNTVYTVGKYSIFNVTRLSSYTHSLIIYVSFCSTGFKGATQTIWAMPPRPRVAIRQARKLICPAERNMLREMYNFDRHAARVPVFYLYKLSYVVIVKTKDKSNWAD
jgi:hypothetical protein